MRILMVSSEVESFARTGGLGDVVEALSRALADLGADVIVVTPMYGITKVPENATWWDSPIESPLGELPLGGRSIRVLEAQLPTKRPSAGRLRVCLVADPPLFSRNGIYVDEHGPFTDNPLRFAILSRAALAIAARAWGVPGLSAGSGDTAQADAGPDIIHAHDWHAVPAVLYAKLAMGDAWRACPAVFTIHNLAFQGTMGVEALAELGIPESAWSSGALKHFDSVNWMKGAIELSDRVTTVSETYAREILEPANGHGLDVHLGAHASKLVGIVNGIDADAFDPATEPPIAQRYAARDLRDMRETLAGKHACKRALLRECGMDPDDDGPLFATVSRLTSQKGIDLIADITPALVARGGRILVVGQGDPPYERALHDLAARFPGRVVARIEFDAALARRIFAGSDFLLVPSRYEPCGLTQMYAMRYGSIPIVTPVGGLRDTVAPLFAARATGTGIVTASVDAPALLIACEDALNVRNDSVAWPALVHRAMTRDSSWSSSAAKYMALYSELSAARPR